MKRSLPLKEDVYYFQFPSRGACVTTQPQREALFSLGVRRSGDKFRPELLLGFFRKGRTGKQLETG